MGRLGAPLCAWHPFPQNRPWLRAQGMGGKLGTATAAGRGAPRPTRPQAVVLQEGGLIAGTPMTRNRVLGLQGHTQEEGDLHRL